MDLPEPLRNRFGRIGRFALAVGLVVTVGSLAAAIAAVRLDGFLALGSALGTAIFFVFLGIAWVGGWVTGIAYLARAASR